MKTFYIVAGAVLGAIAIFVAIVYIVIWQESPTTPDRAARILLYDSFLPGRALSNAKAYGDLILPPLQRESHDFKRLNSRNSEYVAQVMASNPSPASLKLSRELYERKALYPKLVGAVGLAAHGQYPEPITASAFLVRVALDEYPKYPHPPGELVGASSWQQLTGYDVLAILALGYSKNPKALPFLIKALNGRNQWSARITATYVSIGNLGDRNAIPTLEANLRNPHKFTIASLYAALKLGDKNAVPLAFPRLRNAPEYVKDAGPIDISLENFLENITNRRYGGDVRAWQAWWATNGVHWKIPKNLNCGPCFPYLPDDP